MCFKVKLEVFWFIRKVFLSNFNQESETTVGECGSQGQVKMRNVVSSVPCSPCATSLDGRFADLQRRKVVSGGFFAWKMKNLNDKNKLNHHLYPSYRVVLQNPIAQH
jgi:hypothetical protein